MEFDQLMADCQWDSHPNNPANEDYEPDLYEQADYWHDMTKDEGGEE